MGHIITEFVALVLITVGYLPAAIALSLALTRCLFSALLPYLGIAALCGLAGSSLVSPEEEMVENRKEE